MTSRNSPSQAKRIIGLFPDLLGVGGVQEAGRLTAAALHEIAHRHGWLTEFLSLNDPPGTKTLSHDGNQVCFRGFARAKVRFVISAFIQARGNARIVFAAHPHLALPAAWMKLVSPRLQTIVMSHGIEVWKPLPPLRQGALRNANCVLAPSRDTARKLSDVQGVSPERVQRLAWPLSPLFFRLADRAANLSPPSGFPQGQIILTVGRWAASERYKGEDELLRAVVQLRPAYPGLYLVAVGGGDDLPRIQKLASDLGVADHVRFLDGVPREKLAACYAHADIFALPSQGEGFGMVFLEAMAFAKPVIGAACGGTTDLVRDGFNGLLVPPGDSQQLAQALDRLLRDESLRTELGRRGAEMARREYDFETFREGLERILGRCGLDSSFSA